MFHQKHRYNKVTIRSMLLASKPSSGQDVVNSSVMYLQSLLSFSSCFCLTKAVKYGEEPDQTSP